MTGQSNYRVKGSWSVINFYFNADHGRCQGRYQGRYRDVGGHNRGRLRIRLDNISFYGTYTPKPDFVA